MTIFVYKFGEVLQYHFLSRVFAYAGAGNSKRLPTPFVVTAGGREQGAGQGCFIP
jgi:hypothetical protein